LFNVTSFSYQAYYVYQVLRDYSEVVTNLSEILNQCFWKTVKGASVFCGINKIVLGSEYNCWKQR